MTEIRKLLQRRTQRQNPNHPSIVGMKILGQGDLRTRQDEALKYALGLGLLDAFTIGAESRAEQEDVIQRITAAA